MLLDELAERCHERNKAKKAQGQCRDCTYGKDCPHDCAKCLQYIHFPHKAPAKRHYDCPHMADYYYCKYSFRYASEIVYGLRQFKELQDKRALKVLSIGCGPCTELAAIDAMRQEGELNYDTLEFRGIDPLSDVWGDIWDDIKFLKGDIEYPEDDFEYLEGDFEYHEKIKFYQGDAFTAIDIMEQEHWIPDLIIFQYVFSDMHKNKKRKYIEAFIEDLAYFLDEQTNKKIYILANDINLSISYGGGREFFDMLADKIQSPKKVKRFHFDSSDRDSHFDYVREYASNDLIFDISSKEIEKTYEPFDSCASAQILIKKLKEEN